MLRKNYFIKFGRRLTRGRLASNTVMASLLSAWTFGVPLLAQQPITGIITDFNGFFQSSESAISDIRPNAANNLLAFSINGVSYSTAVDDATLNANGIDYQAELFRAFRPIEFNTTTFGQGSADDGDISQTLAPIYPVSNDNVTQYLVDGINGLNIASFANNVGGTVNFNLSNVDVAANSDGSPEIIYFTVTVAGAGLTEFRLFDAFDVQIIATLVVAANWLNLLSRNQNRW